MKVLLLFALVGAALSQPHDVSEAEMEEWELFKVKYEKEYVSTVEEEKRQKNFVNSLRFVKEHNKKYENGEVTYAVAINKFADLTSEEIVARMNGFRKPEGPRQGKPFVVSEDLAIPKKKDWRKAGAVTPVKNQGECGSCWAFSTTGSLEGQTFLKTKKLISLSEQNLIDCSTNGNDGCAGGYTENAFTYIQTNNGIDTEASYPYEAKNNTCRYKSKNKGATDTGYVNIPEGDEKSLQKAVATVGPISVAIDATRFTFLLYSYGVYDDPLCSITNLDHAVLAVGYGHQKNGGDYWLVKNSWGTDWGMEGYILMSRNKQNQCGIATDANYPTV